MQSSLPRPVLLLRLSRHSSEAAGRSRVWAQEPCVTRRLMQSPSMAKLALLVPDVELWLAELRPARGLPPHTFPGGAGEGSGEGSSGGTGESDGGDTTAVSWPPVSPSAGLRVGWPPAGGAPRSFNMASSATMAAVTLSRPPVITLSAPSGTLSTVSMISFFSSA